MDNNNNEQKTIEQRIWSVSYRFFNLILTETDIEQIKKIMKNNDIFSAVEEYIWLRKHS